MLTGNFSSVSTVDAPTPPYGFDVDLHYDSSVKLNPLGVYLTSIDCMYKFARKGWNEVMPGGFTVWTDEYNAEIDGEAAQAPGGPLPFRTSHIVLGLWAALVEVSTQSKFCELRASIYLQRRQIGALAIRPKGSHLINNHNVAFHNATIQTLLNNTATYPSGRIPDPDNKELTISYTYTGDRINSRDVFMSVIGGLVDIAPFDPLAPFESFTAISPSGKCVTTFVKLDDQSPISFSFIVTALRLIIWDVIVKLRKFEAMTIALEWNGVRTAEGSIKAQGSGSAVQKQ